MALSFASIAKLPFFSVQVAVRFVAMYVSPAAFMADSNYVGVMPA